LKRGEKIVLPGEGEYRQDEIIYYKLGFINSEKI
jgi:hypothetical protein